MSVLIGIGVAVIFMDVGDGKVGNGGVLVGGKTGEGGVLVGGRIIIAVIVGRPKVGGIGVGVANMIYVGDGYIGRISCVGVGSSGGPDWLGRTNGVMDGYSEAVGGMKGVTVGKGLGVSLPRPGLLSSRRPPQQ